MTSDNTRSRNTVISSGLNCKYKTSTVLSDDTNIANIIIIRLAQNKRNRKGVIRTISYKMALKQITNNKVRTN